MSDRHYEKPLPETITTFLEDGSVSVSVGNITGVVNSYHLIQPKAHQLQKAWLKRQSDLVDASN